MHHRAFVRDRTTWQLYLLFASWGWFLFAFGPSLALLGDEQGATATQIGLHGTALAAGTLLSGLSQAPLVGRLGRRGVLWGGAAVVVLAVLGLTVPIGQGGVGTPAVTLSAAALAGWGGSTMVNATAPALIDHHGRAGSAAFTEANALGAGVGAAAPLVIGAAIALGLGWRTGLLMLLPMLAVIWLLFRTCPVPPVVAHEQDTERRLPGAYWWAWGLVVSGIGAEFCFTIWGTTLVAERTGAADASAAGTLTAFVLGMALGRLQGARLSLRVPSGQLILMALGVTATGWALLWTSTTLVIAVGGLFVAGLGIAVLFPIGVSRAIERSGGRSDLATGRVAIGAGLAIGLAPLTLGRLADAVGLERAFLVVPALLVVAVSLLGISSAGGRRDAQARGARTG